MHSNTFTEMQSRLERLERQNRRLTVIVCAMIGIATIAATKQSSDIITAAQIRAQRITLIDNQGKPLVDTQGLNGSEIREYLPHNVIQR